MSEDQRELPLDYDDDDIETVNVFETLDNMSEDEVKEMAETMMLPSDKRITALAALEDLAKVGIHYAVYGRYIASERPYVPSPDELSQIIGSKISILATAVKDKLPEMYIWALDSAIMTDITQNSLRTAAVTANAMEEKEETKAYPH